MLWFLLALTSKHIFLGEMASDYNENFTLGKHLIQFICSELFAKLMEPIFLTQSTYR